MSVLDSSAVLAILNREPGASVVRNTMADGGASISTVNVTEILTRLIDRGESITDASGLVETFPLTVVPFDLQLARLAAALREHTRHLGLSLGDRACLALGLLRGGPVLTADRDWAGLDLGVEIEVIR